jgi:DNA repair exonuclease SbcCD ATPase subunit
MRAADVQAMLNNETQRTIDGYKAKIDYHSRDTATAQERAIALQTEAEMMGKLKEKQEGVHKEANYLREALAKLEQRQSTVNATTDEGWDAYKKLESQIENIKDSIEKLGIEWFNLAKAQEVGISGLEKVRSLRATEIDQLETQIKHLIRANATANEIAEADRLRTRVLELYNEKIAENINKISEQEKHLTTAKELLDAGKISQEQYNRELAESNKLTAEYSKELTGFKQKMEDVGSVTYAAARALSNFDYFAKQGVYSIERQLSEVQSIYSQFENLTIEHQRDYYNRQAGYYKQMLLDMKRDAEDAYHDRIKLLERETEGAIALIQRQIDALDEEAKQEDREEERRKHEERLKELYEKRRYHELRTGREHSEAILDIDKQIGEEQRRWEQRQAEWTREDKKDELRKEIEDVRDAAEKQREKWQEVYEAMQRDFSDHNLSLIALASAYDPAFFDDAKNKAEQWVQGFKQGTAGFGDYLSSLTPSAGRVVDSIRDEWERPYYEEPEPEPEPPAKPEPEFPPSYTIEQWGHVYTVKDGGHVILKNGRYIPAEDFKYLPSEILQLARDMKMGKAHTGAMTASAGIAELIPGEMIFPPNLSIQLERLISTLSARPLPAQAQQQWRGGGVEIRGNLLNVEKASFEDETDMEILARELNRQLTSLRN